MKTSRAKLIVADSCIIGHENYIVANDGNIYNCKLNRKLKLTYNSLSIGWWIGKKFIVKNKLNEHTQLMTPKFILL